MAVGPHQAPTLRRGICPLDLQVDSKVYPADPADLPGRLHQWRQVATHVTDRTPTDGGIRLQLDAGTPLGDLAELIAAEQHCCAFFSFALTVDGRGRALEVRGPAEAVALFA